MLTIKFSFSLIFSIKYIMLVWLICMMCYAAPFCATWWINKSLWVLREFKNQFLALSYQIMHCFVRFCPGFNQAAAVFVPVDGLSNQLDARKVGHVDCFSAGKVDIGRTETYWDSLAHVAHGANMNVDEHGWTITTAQRVILWYLM